VLTLSVFRDGTLHSQAELTVYGLRIGRGGENDIVLEDAAKRVSRLHAELRVDADGTVTLADQQSANGTWIAGEQIETVILEPGVPFTIGPYRLMLEAQPDSAAAETRDSIPAPAVPPPGSEIAPPPASPQTLKKGDTTKTAWNLAGARDLAMKHRWAVLLGGGAAVLLGGVGIWSMAAGPEPAPPPPIEKKTERLPEPPPAPAPVPVDPKADLITEAQALIAAGDKASAQAALDGPIAKILALDAEDVEGLGLKTDAEKIVNMQVAPPPVRPTVRLKVEEVHDIPLRAGEKQADYEKRVKDLQNRLAGARAAADRGDYAAALLALESILNSEPQYTDAKDELGRVQNDRADAGKAQLAEAEGLAKKGALVEAIEAFEKARSVDPSLVVAPHIEEIRTRMTQEGRKAYGDGMVFSMSGRRDSAILFLRRAYLYLPEGDPEKAKARAELERLGVGVK
jgi:tetratricopeptide (TPR) repeat protein